MSVRKVVRRITHHHQADTRECLLAYEGAQLGESAEILESGETLVLTSFGWAAMPLLTDEARASGADRMTMNINELTRLKEALFFVIHHEGFVSLSVTTLPGLKYKCDLEGGPEKGIAITSGSWEETILGAEEKLQEWSLE